MNQFALQMALQDSSKFGRVGAGGVIFANFILWFSSILFFFIGIEISINHLF